MSVLKKPQLLSFINVIYPMLLIKKKKPQPETGMLILYRFFHPPHQIPCFPIRLHQLQHLHNLLLIKHQTLTFTLVVIRFPLCRMDLLLLRR